MIFHMIKIKVILLIKHQNHKLQK